MAGIESNSFEIPLFPISLLFPFLRSSDVFILIYPRSIAWNGL